MEQYCLFIIAVWCISVYEFVSKRVKYISGATDNNENRETSVQIEAFLSYHWEYWLSECVCSAEKHFTVDLSLKVDLFLVAVTMCSIFINMIVGNSVRQHTAVLTVMYTL